MKLSLPTLSIPRPTAWDLVAVVVAISGVVIAGANWTAAGASSRGAMESSTAVYFVLAQLAVTAVNLFVLGKTAKAGTITGNLAAVAGIMIGVSGALLASALWVAA